MGRRKSADYQLGRAGAGRGGALLLALEGDFSASGWGALLAFGAPLCWSIGSYASRRLSLPPPAMASAAQWLVGGAMGLVVALWFEPVQQLGHASTFLAGVELSVGDGYAGGAQRLPVVLQNTSAAWRGAIRS